MLKSVILAVYRPIAIGLTMSYLDYWSVIPIVILFLSSYVIITQSDTKIHKDNDEIDGFTGLVWDGDEWIGLETSVISSNSSNTKIKVESSENKNLSYYI